MSENKSLEGFNTYEEFITYYEDPWHGNYFEFVYKDEFYQVVLDLGQDVENRIAVYQVSKYFTNDNFYKVKIKDSKFYPGIHLRKVFADYRFPDGTTIKEAFIRGEIRINFIS